MIQAQTGQHPTINAGNKFALNRILNTILTTGVRVWPQYQNKIALPEDRAPFFDSRIFHGKESLTGFFRRIYLVQLFLVGLIQNL